MFGNFMKNYQSILNVI